MGTEVENDSFDELELEILLIKGGPGIQTGGTPPGAVWRSLRTWRRVLRTMIPSSPGNGVDTIGKSIKTHADPCRELLKS